MTAMETDGELFDLEAYANSYTGHGKIARLQFILKQAAGSRLELDALRMTADELKKGINIKQYEEVVQKISGRLGAEYTADLQWVSKAQSKAATDLARLEHALTGSKTSLRKEAIRLGHVELARHHMATGNLQEAFKCYVRTRDLCTTPADILTMCLHVITTSLAMQSWTNVHNYASKAEGIPDVSTHPVQHSKVKCAEAVALMHDGKYKAAARRFTEASPEMGTSFNEALSPQDIATMGALCSLASLSRPELKRQVVDNLGFREYLEAVPEVCPDLNSAGMHSGQVRDMVQDFYSAQYAHALDRLAKLTPVLQLDLHLASHVKPLTQALRSRALVQYTQSFVAVKLSSMSNVFSCNSDDLEAELAKLIEQGQVAGRLDGHAKVLHARRPNQRSVSFKAALAAGDEYLYNAQAALIRASLTKHDMIQRPAMMTKKGLGFRDR